MAEFNNLYQRAVYYDIVFDRDVSSEIEFVAALYRQCHGVDPRAVLDLACGPGYHARAFAKRYGRAVGLDLRPEMLALGAERAAQDGVQVEWLSADMRYFTLPEPVDIALNVFDGIDCLNTNRDLVAHFRAVAANLTPGGLYCIDVTNPRYTSFSHYEPVSFHGKREGIAVDIYWATNNPAFDPVTGVSHTQLEIHINDHGERFVISDVAHERVLSGQEIALLAELSGVFQPIGWYGGYDLNMPFTNAPDHLRMIAVLQQTAG